MHTVIIHYHEIALKGKNRPRFIKALVDNIRRATSDLGIRNLRALRGRIALDVGEAETTEEVLRRVAETFGVANVSLGIRTERDLEALGACIEQALIGRAFSSFRITTHRGDKTFPMISPEINRELGARVVSQCGAKVALDNPELNVHVEIAQECAFVYFDKQKGPGGLPVGVSGKVLCLISGGIDSPVAAFRCMMRGLRVTFVHFHSYPYQDQASQEKVVELVRLLTERQYRSRLHLVPFGDVQQKIIALAPAKLRILLYRRFMIRIADALARRGRIRALCTGESIGQVASQTLDNLSVVQEVATFPILRPLICMNKDEIIEQAQEIGSYEISILPDQDCCQLYTPKHPETHARREDLSEAEAVLDIERLVAEALDGVETRDFEYPE